MAVLNWHTFIDEWSLRNVLETSGGLFSMEFM